VNATLRHAYAMRAAREVGRGQVPDELRLTALSHYATSKKPPWWAKRAWKKLGEFSKRAR